MELPDLSADAMRAANIIDRVVNEGGCPGAAVVVIKGRDIVLEQYAGEAARGLSAAPSVLWPVASISKLYTATMIMRLVEDGVLTMNTPVCEVIPSFRGEGREEVNLRHLLTHTAGMVYESPKMEDRLKALTPIQDLVDEALGAPLLFKPGTRFRYADNHYLIAGRMAEAATQVPFPELVRTLVLAPAGLTHTFIPPGPADEHRLAIVRGVKAEGTAGAMYNSRYARALAHPAFGVFATVTDLARFGSLFKPLHPMLLSAPAVRAMTTDQAGQALGQPPVLGGFASDVRVPWGFGFGLQNEQAPCLHCDLASLRAFGHAGATGCNLVIDPMYDLVVAVMSNAHVSLGERRWYMRLHSITNSMFTQFA